MKILIEALNKINVLNKNQYDFFILLIQGFIGIAGKRTFKNLARYMEITQHTFLRQMAKIFDFMGLNTEMLKASKKVDARLRREYKGPQKTRGRKKKYDNGSVGDDDFKESPVTKITQENIELRQCRVHSISLKRLINVVLVRKYEAPDKYAEAFLFSTDLELDAITIYQYYVARFQIEFIFRDGKGFTGLTDFQTRDARRIHFHINASLTALNVAKLQDVAMQQERGVQHAFSMASWARKYHVDIVINRFISMFGFDQTSIKSHPNYDSFLSFGGIIH